MGRLHTTRTAPGPRQRAIGLPPLRRPTQHEPHAPRRVWGNFPTQKEQCLGSLNYQLGDHPRPFPPREIAATVCTPHAPLPSRGSAQLGFRHFAGLPSTNPTHREGCGETSPPKKNSAWEPHPVQRAFGVTVCTPHAPLPARGSAQLGFRHFAGQPSTNPTHREGCGETSPPKKNRTSPPKRTVPWEPELPTERSPPPVPNELVLAGASACNS